MADTIQLEKTLEEIWEEIGKKIWEEILPNSLRPKFGEVFILLTIYDGKLVKGRGHSECGVIYEKN